MMSCNLSNSLDCVNHGILKSKLEYYSVRRVSFEVYYNISEKQNAKSASCGGIIQLETIDCGVHQGSILAPLLFLIHMNDLTSNVSSSERCLYADDTNFVNVRDSAADVTLQSNITLFEANRQFSTNGQLLHIGNTQRITFNTATIALKRFLKFLGMHLQHDLKWATHIININFFHVHQDDTRCKDKYLELFKRLKFTTHGINSVCVKVYNAFPADIKDLCRQF